MHFQFRWIPALATLAGLALLIWLGLWQDGKGERLAAELAQRQARAQLGAVRIDAALVEASALNAAPISVTGRYEPDGQFFLDNRQLDGQPGLDVLTPLLIAGSQTRILVNRGWVAWPHGRGVLPTVVVPTGDVTVHGLASVPSTKKFFLMPEAPPTQGALRLRVDLAAIATQTGQPWQPVLLLQNQDDANDPLVRRWQPPENRVDKHR
ncbi:MAG: SURF1 family protein, partial [Rhodoferax sp.]|nr:SURF1 family protein [Rhodoferax sp.]